MIKLLSSLRIILGAAKGLGRMTLKPETSFLVILKKRKTCYENTCYESFNSLVALILLPITAQIAFKIRQLYLQGYLTFILLFTGLSVFHTLVVTFLKTSLKTSTRKTAPKEFHYRDYNKFNAGGLKTELKQNLAANCSNYESLSKHS